MAKKPAFFYLAVRRKKSDEWQIYPTNDSEYLMASYRRVREDCPKWEVITFQTLDGSIRDRRMAAARPTLFKVALP